jgi:hypothetical protein
MIYNQKRLEYWDCFALHTWLILSSFGIFYAILSFIQDLGGLKQTNEYPWIKGVIAITSGILFYIFIGLRHLEGARIRGIELD